MGAAVPPLLNVSSDPVLYVKSNSALNMVISDNKMVLWHQKRLFQLRQLLVCGRQQGLIVDKNIPDRVGRFHNERFLIIGQA